MEVLGLYSMDLDMFLKHADNHDHLVTATELNFVCNEFHADKGHSRQPWKGSVYSCNNLLLGETKYGYYMINPATREMKNVPKTPTWRPTAVRPILMSLCGFGFDYSTNEYKVVNGQIYNDYIVFSIYRLKTDVWRRIECHAYKYGNGFQGIFLNGAIHWVAEKVSVEPPQVILTFLLAEEEVGEIQLPPITTCSPITLGVFRDCLCITFGNYIDQLSEEFWVMKEYRVSESWTKMRFSMPYRVLQGFGFSTKSHEVMLCDNSFVMYDSQKESYKKLQIRDTPAVAYCLGVYVEGLFPLIDHARDDESDVTPDEAYMKQIMF
ncbi:F-box/kelch-repeat protein At3g06240-like [Argentina anserina]|uniref:F-box/kelch-repeat protein At3g06240-like n=1 Tax=Argentina anserina TaxID=57926 RepID=UPI00217668A2|nr:F-box/kelch-repeat protein At3g06240-like [Potentilla anserina]